MKRVLFICVAWTCLAASHAQPTDFRERCEKLVADARLSVVFEDIPLARDNTRSLEDLKHLSQAGPQPHHLVYGLTYAQTKTSYDIRTQILSEPDGRLCAVPSVALKIGLSELTVYLAKELTNPCQRAIVEEHEQEHVATWRNHLRAGSRLLEPVLRRDLLRPLYFTPADRSHGDMQTMLKRHMEDVLNPLMSSLQNGIQASHRQIDAPLSYQAAAQRIRACP